MGTHILNLGNNRTEKYTPDINMINSKSNSSTGNQVANTFINTVFGFGAIALSGAMAKKGTSNTQTKQTQEAEQKNPTLTEYQKVTIQLTQCDGTLKGLREQLKTANKEVIRLTKATDENEIKAKEAEVNKLKEELYTKNGAYQENVSKVVACDEKVATATSTLETATNNYNSISSEIASLKQTKAGQEALIKDGYPNAEKAKEYSARLDKQIEQKEIIKTQAEKDMKVAQKALEDANTEKSRLQKEMGPKYQEIQNTKASYDKQNAELTSYKNGLTANKTALKNLTETVLPKLKVQIADLEQHSMELNDDLLEISGKDALAQQETNNEIKDYAKKYNDAKNNDGNWWKRNMPTWLGGSNKANKAEYKKNHEAKNAIATGLKQDYDINVKDYLKTDKTTNTLNYVKANNCKGLYNYIEKLYKNNPSITDAEIKTNLDTLAKNIIKDNKTNAKAALKKAGFSDDQIKKYLPKPQQFLDSQTTGNKLVMGTERFDIT